jgi:hypothetical protein
MHDADTTNDFIHARLASLLEICHSSAARLYDFLHFATSAIADLFDCLQPRHLVLDGWLTRLEVILSFHEVRLARMELMQ